MTEFEGLVRLAYLLPPLVTALSAAGISYWIYRRRWDVRGARTFVVMLFVGGLCWQPLILVQLLATEPQVVRTATALGHLFGWTAVMTFVVFASQYTTSGFHRRRVVQLMIGSVLGGMVALSVMSVPQGTVAVRTGQLPFSYGDIGQEPLRLLVIAVGYTLVIVAYYLIMRYLQSARDGARTRIVLITLGTVIVAVLNLLSVARLVPPAGFEYAAYGALPFIIFSTVAIFRLGLLDIVPVARRTLVETLSDPVIVVTDDRRIADFNRAAEQLYPAMASGLGNQLADICPELAERIVFPESGTPLTDTISLPAEGRLKHYSVLVSPVQQPRRDDPVGYSILVRDVTEMESSRRALEKQNKQLDRVAATVSHDLRNPLTVASGHTTLLAERADDDMQMHVDEIASAHDRIDAIIDDVLTMTREEQSPTTLESVDLETVARDAWDSVATDSATLHVEGTAVLETDRGRLRRILENLFRNAVEHSSTDPESKIGQDNVEHGSPGSPQAGRQPATDASGELTVRLSTLGGAESEGFAGFAVADNGPGIPAEIEETLFEYGVTTSDEGTGIGLDTVQRLSQSLGLSVSHDTSYTGGTRFVFRPIEESN